MKYKVGDKFEDKKECGVIEIIEVAQGVKNSNDGYEIIIDGVKWDYGVTEHYLDKNCIKIN